ncbi:MAG: hypothetical protein ACJ76X_04025 [Solirubrobacteraceae bacterium]
MTHEPAGGLERQAQVMRAVRQAGNGWAEAMRSHKLAPPDLSFSNRLRALAEAAAREQVAWEHAHAAGLLWRPVPGAEHAEPPYELRPGTGRRGPAELWARFDAAVQTLNRAITGSDAANVADAFGEISEAATALADVIARDDATALADMIARGDTGRDAGTGRQAVAGEGSQAPADTAPPRERGAA